MIFISYLLVSCIKFLFIPAYRSTDFEVHRNWLAIAYNLPIDKWYFEDSSEWTLDYPPLFAWFEYLLSYIAKFFDAEMLKLNNHYYASFETILFQRLSVIITDFVFAYGTYRCCLMFNAGWRSTVVLPLLLITNTGLLMIDHIHFQYNGILYGTLLISFAYMLKHHYIKGAFWFLILLNMKHLYLYVAPAYFIYLLRNYCFSTKSLNFNNIFKSFSITNFFRLATTVLFVYILTFLPFLHQLKQIYSRLFPFKRGLCHAYWAPNVWAIYNVIDKAAVIIGHKMDLIVTTDAASMTGGLVQEFSHSVLPNVMPLATIILTVIFMLPALIKLWFSGPNVLQFIRCIVICALTSYLFGWHVHEKAILMAIIPLSILSIVEPEDAKVFLLLSTVGHYSILPLLFPKSLVVIKVTFFILYCCFAFYSLSNMYPLYLSKYSLPMLNLFESLYLTGLVPLFLYDNILHYVFGLQNILPFLPLMLTSFYCSIGVIYCWFRYYLNFLIKRDLSHKAVTKK